MADRNHLCPSGCSWSDRAELIRMFDMLLGLCTFGQFDEQLPMGPHFEDPVPLSHLDHGPGHWRGRRANIQDTIVGEGALQTYLLLFTGKALPSQRGRQRSKWVLVPRVSWA